MNIREVTTKKELDDAMFVRMTVFVKEQNVPEDEEVDAHDETAIHFAGYLDNEPVAASRLRFIDGFGKLERISVLKEFRGRHFGKKLIEKMEETIQKHGVNQAKLNAQTHAESFYAEQGYETVSDVFMDAGIPHVTMVKKLSS